MQLDTISVLARSHELVAYARLGPVPRAELEAAYWGQPARAFEYTAHAACIMPIDLWPFLAFRRRAVRERERGRSRLAPSLVEEVRSRLRDGPITTTDVGGARESAGWWNWSDAKVALEGLYRRGEAAVTTRRGWKRVYDLSERALPAHLLARDPTDEECYLELVKVAARALGVGTARDIAGYFLLTMPYAGVAPNARRLVAGAIEAAGLLPVRVEGWREAAFADPAALSVAPPDPSRTTLLSPFDPLVWATPAPGQLQEREYPRRVFDFSYSFEAYVPREKRRHGYFTMPLLAADRLVGRIDPLRRGKTLVAQRVSLEAPEGVPAAAAALSEAAAWVGCTDIEVEDVLPEPLRTGLLSHL